MDHNDNTMICDTVTIYC